MQCEPLVAIGSANVLPLLSSNVLKIGLDRSVRFVELSTDHKIGPIQ